MEEKEKIGFGNEPIDPHQKQKFKSVNKRSKIRKLSTSLVVIGTLLSVTATGYMFLPVFNGIIVVTVAIIFGLIILLTLFLTLFIIVASKEYRSWLDSTWGFISDIANLNFDKLNPYYPYFAIAAISVDLFAIIASSIGRKKEKKGYVTYIVYMLANLSLCTLFLILYYINGNRIFS